MEKDRALACVNVSRVVHTVEIGLNYLYRLEIKSAIISYQRDAIVPPSYLYSQWRIQTLSTVSPFCFLIAGQEVVLRSFIREAACLIPITTGE